MQQIFSDLAWTDAQESPSLTGIFFQLTQPQRTLRRMDWIITGASRGIGRALALGLASRAEAHSDRLFVIARDRESLRDLAEAAGPRVPVLVYPADLSRLAGVVDVGRRLVDAVQPGAVLVHNAGLWPTALQRSDGLETAYVVNCLAPLALQRPLLAASRLSRVLLIGAGLMVQGRFDATKTPVGADFSRLRSYCSTKLAGAVAMRDVALRHPQVDFAVVHPGVVNTDLGVMAGPLGWLLRRVKRSWETPEVCAARLLRLLALPRWQQSPGQAPWFVEETRQDWPTAAERDAAAILSAVAQHLPS